MNKTQVTSYAVVSLNRLIFVNADNSMVVGVVAQVDDVQIDHIRTSYHIADILQLVNTLGGTGRFVAHLNERNCYRLGH